MAAMIEFFDVSRFYPGEIAALQNITFSIEPGEMVFLTGPSGAGKSTLLKMVAAIEKPDSGFLTVNGQDIGKLKAAGISALRQNLGLILQQPNLLHDRNILSNVMLPLTISGATHTEAQARAYAALDKVGLLESSYFFPQALSEGESSGLLLRAPLSTTPESSWLMSLLPTLTGTVRSRYLPRSGFSSRPA